MMRTLLLSMALLAIAAPLATAADLGVGIADLPTTQNHDFVNCAMTHIGWFVDSLNPVHLVHPVAPCLIH